MRYHITRPLLFVPRVTVEKRFNCIMVYLAHVIVINHSLFLGFGGLGVTLLKGKSSYKLKLSSSEIANYVMRLNHRTFNYNTLPKFTKYKCNKNENFFTKTLGSYDELVVKFAVLVL